MKMTEPNSIGERIRLLRQAKKLTPGQLALKCEIGENALRKIENGESKAPSFVTGVRLARALGVDPWYLAFGEEGGAIQVERDRVEALTAQMEAISAALRARGIIQ